MREAIRLINPEFGLKRQALAAVQQLVAKRGGVPTEYVQEAAEFLTELWAVAVRHGITPGRFGGRDHLARAALDTVIAEHRPQRGGHKR